MEIFNVKKSNNILVITIVVQMVFNIGCPINMLKIQNKIERYDKIIELLSN